MTDVALADQAIGMNVLRRLMREPVDPIAAPAAGDKRFGDPAWSKNPFLAGMLESYLARARAALALVESSRLPEPTRRKAQVHPEHADRRARADQHALDQPHRRQRGDRLRRRAA